MRFTDQPPITSAMTLSMRATTSTLTSQPRAQFHNNQYGASLGGPIIKDKTFFYADYEGQEEPVGVVTEVRSRPGSDRSRHRQERSDQSSDCRLAGAESVASAKHSGDLRWIAGRS